MQSAYVWMRMVCGDLNRADYPFCGVFDFGLTWFWVFSHLWFHTMRSPKMICALTWNRGQFNSTRSVRCIHQHNKWYDGDLLKKTITQMFVNNAPMIVIRGVRPLRLLEVHHRIRPLVVFHIFSCNQQIPSGSCAYIILWTNRGLYVLPVIFIRFGWFVDSIANKTPSLSEIWSRNIHFRSNVREEMLFFLLHLPRYFWRKKREKQQTTIENYLQYILFIYLFQ